MKSNIIGIIAEDDSDVESIKILIERIINRHISKKSYVGKGYGKVLRKCKNWANLLFDKKCDLVVIVSDSDSSKPEHRHNAIMNEMRKCKSKDYFICIPVQELEAWFLSDPKCIQEIFKLQKLPKFSHVPECIDSPKEYLAKTVRKFSRVKTYIHTKDNKEIASKICLSEISKKCNSFKLFHTFIEKTLIV